MKKIATKLWALLLTILLFTGAVPTEAATDYALFATPATASGKYLYASLDYGNLYRYNISTGKRALLMRGKCDEVTKKGNYLYFTYDSSNGGTVHYEIYRMTTSGKHKKFLSSGHQPVLIGNYIYYIATQRVHEDSGYEYDTAVGVYRMNLDGSGNTCIFNSDHENIILLASSGSRLFILTVLTGANSYCYNTKTQKITPISLEAFERNYRTMDGSAYGDGYNFSYSGNTIYRSKAGKKTRLMTVEGKVIKMFYTNGYLVAVSEDSAAQKAYGYVIRKDGKVKKLIDSWPLQD